MISSQDFVIKFLNLSSPRLFRFFIRIQYSSSAPLCLTDRSFLTWRASPLQGIVAHFCSVGISPVAGFNFIRAKQKAPYIFSRTAKLTVCKNKLSECVFVSICKEPYGEYCVGRADNVSTVFYINNYV